MLFIVMFIILFSIPIKADPVINEITKTFCDNNLCSKILSSGYTQSFIDETIEKETNWLKYYNVVYLERDEKTDIIIKNFNRTHIEFNLKIAEELISTTIPLKLCDIDPNSKDAVCYQMNYKLNAVSRDYVLEIKALEKRYIKFGLDSTTIQLVEPNTDNLEDTDTRENDPDTVYSTNDWAVVGIDASLSQSNAYWKYNLSTLGTVFAINSSEACFYITSNEFEQFQYDEALSIWEVSNQTWTEETTTWNSPVAHEDLIDTITEPGWLPDITLCFNVTDWVIESYENGDANISFFTNITSYGTTLPDRASLKTKEETTASQRPYLNITYTPMPEDEVSPTWSLNSTNNTNAGDPTLFSLYWEDMFNSTESGNLDGYIFSLHNGTNWTDVVCSDYNYSESSCEEFGCDFYENGELGAEVYFFDDFNLDTTDWTLGNWIWTTSSTYCLNDAYDKCIRSSTLDTEIYSTTDIDLSNCISGSIWVWESVYDQAVDSLEYLRNGLSPDGGNSWYWANINNGGSQTSSRFIINTTGISSPYNVSNFRIGFDTTGTDTAEYYYIDNLTIGCLANKDICNGTSNYEFKNITFTLMSGAGNWSNETHIIPSGAGKDIKWIVYANDSNDNWNASDTFIFTSTGTEGTNYNYTNSLTLSWNDQNYRKLNAKRNKSLSLDFEDNANRKLSASRSGDLTLAWDDNIYSTVIRLISRLVSIALIIPSYN